MIWSCPIPYTLIPTENSESFSSMKKGETGLPIGSHLGAFGVRRKHHFHEGVDLYCPEGTLVFSVEDGVVVAVIPFTGAHAEPPSPWWHDTWAVMVEGASGVVLYGEVTPSVEVGDLVYASAVLGEVKQVLTKDKGRPMSMLHLELHRHATRDAYEWTDESGRPDSLLDPTIHLAGAKYDQK